MLYERKKLISLLTVLVLMINLILPNSIVNAAGENDLHNEEVTKIQVLSTTDSHGKFINYDYATNSVAAGGMNQVAAQVKVEKEKNPNTLLIDNGDTIQGNYNHLFLGESFLKNKTNPMILSLQTMGYDSMTLGNHEFNYGMKILDILKNQAESGNVSVLCANLYKDNKRVFKPYIIREFNGVKVAVIGVTTNHITRWDAEKLEGYDPRNPAKEVQKVIAELKSNNAADVFVVSSHMGLNEEYGDGDSATDIAKLNPEVSLIIAGHSHVSIKDTEVNGVMIVQPKNLGAELSKVELSVKKTNEGVKVVNRNADIIPFAKDSKVDEELTNKLQEYNDIAIADAKTKIGELKGSNLASDNEIKGIPESFVKDEGVTDLINEVQLYYSNKHLQSINVNTDNIHHVSGAAMLSATANLMQGDISKAGLANIYKFDNKLYTVKTTGKQLKKYLEWSASFYNTFKNGDLTVSFDPEFASYKYDMLSGINYEINISKDAGERIENLTFPDGAKVQDTDEVYLTINDYRYNSNLKPLFDEGEHKLIYESTNDSLSDVRDMIASYIKDVNNGVITKKVDNNWKLTGVSYNEELRNEVIKLINNGTLSYNESFGVISESLNFNSVIKELTEKGKVDEIEAIKKLNTKVIDILSFNDLHGAVLESGKNIGAVKLTGVVKSYKDRQNDNYGVIAVSGGDLYQGTAISNLKHGGPVTDMLKVMGIEASAVGNHEFDWGRDRMYSWAKEGNFDFLAANIIDKNTNKTPGFVKPYKIVEKNGVKIGIIGIATPETLTATKTENVEGLDFVDPIETVNKYAKVVKNEGADVVVVLSHSGSYQDEKTGEITGEAADLANGVKGIDAIISAHSHQFVNGKVNNIPVVQAGNNGRALAKVSFTFDNDNKLKDVTSSLERFAGNEANLPVNEEVNGVINKHEEELTPILNEKVTYLKEELTHDRYDGLSKLGVTVCETMRKIASTDIAICNGGGIRRTLNQGDVTVGDMYEILPFDNTIITLNVKGSDLVKIIEHGINPSNMGWGQFAGIKVWYDEATGKVSSIRLLDGTKIDMDKYYSVAINDFMATGGDGYDFADAKDMINTNIVMRDAIIEEWKANGVPTVEFKLLTAGLDPTVEVPVKVPAKVPETVPTNTVNNEGTENGTKAKTGDNRQIEIFALCMLLAVSSTVTLKTRKKKVN